MIEVFIAFDRHDSIASLEHTLTAWELPGLSPGAIHMQRKSGQRRKYELLRRVSAENIARGHYILAELGFGPVERNFGELAEKELSERQDVGLFGAWRVGQTAHEIPNSVVICRKGVVTHWPPPVTHTYIQEHLQAYQFVGYKTFLCSTLHYRPLSVSLPC